MNIDLTKLPVGEMMIGFLVTAVVATFAIAFTIVDSGTGGEEDGGTEPMATPVIGSTDVVLGDNFFEPADMTVQAGDSLTLNLTNQGAAIHNMHIAGADGAYAVSGICETGGEDPCSDPASMRGGETATLVWDVPDSPGSQVPFRCDFHPADMTGTFTIVGAPEAPAEAAN